MRLARITMIVAVAVLAACAPPPGPAELSAEDLEAIEAVTSSWSEAMNAKDWDALAALYTEDAVMMAPDAPAIEGRAAIREFFVAFPPVESIQLDALDVDGRGDLAFVRGTYIMTLVSEEGPVEDVGKYLEIRRREADGTWRLYADIFNSDLP